MKNVLVKTLDNRSLLLALDYLYRENMKIFPHCRWLMQGTAITIALALLLIAFRPGVAMGENIIPSALSLSGDRSLSDIKVKTLDPPDFKRVPVGRIAKSSDVTLQVISERRNKIIDDEAWYAAHSLARPGWDGVVPEFAPKQFRGLDLTRVIPDGERRFLFYGRDNTSSVLLLAQRLDNKKFEYALDFSKYCFAPRNVHEDRDFVFQRILWATQIGDILYVSHGHSTYAKSSFGMNAYVSAINVRSMKALWHSAPLVSNAHNFEVYGDYLITGYGFTAEPDFLFLLRRDTGEAVARIPVKSGPEYLLRKDSRLYVRTYDTDYVLRIDRRH
jgi:hypothetical protein